MTDTLSVDAPDLRVISLGAGVQSTAMLLLAARGDLGKVDAAIFADTGWEPKAVYAHLDRLDQEVCGPSGIPLHRVSAGNIRDDALDPDRRFASMPLYIRNSDGGDGMTRRQCTSEYKLKPLMRKLRELLGAPTLEDGRIGRVPRGRWAEQLIGISLDESHRALNSKSAGYAQARWPMLDMKLSRSDCVAINEAAGFRDVAKSACIGCPFHGNAQWRKIRDESPHEWADAVAFDHAIRAGSARANAIGSPLLGQAYLHRSRVPLDLAPIDRVTRAEHAGAQIDGLDLLSADAIGTAWADDGEPIVGCGPHTCRASILEEVDEWAP